MTSETGDDPFTRKLRRVCSVLVDGEGFVDAHVEYERATELVSFHATGARAFKMRRDQLEARSDCEIAFFAATRMRPAAATTRPPARPRQ